MRIESMHYFPRALRTLHTLNNVVAHDPTLRRVFLDGEYNYWQMYQALIFLALREAYKNQKQEHTREEAKPLREYAGLLMMLIASIFGFLFTRHRAVAIFSTDRTSSNDSSLGCDFRMEGIYRAMKDRSVPFVEILHTQGGFDMVRNLWKRKRVSMYLEAIDGIARLYPMTLDRGAHEYISNLDLSMFNEDADCVREILLRFLRRVSESRRSIQLWKKIFARMRVTTILALDNVRHYHELVAAARSEHRVVYAFQHGQFTQYQTGWRSGPTGSGHIPKPNTLFVWNEYWKEALIQLGTYFSPDELVVGGIPKNRVPLRAEHYAGSGRIAVVLPYETEAMKNEISQYVAALQQCPDIDLYFKIRPDVPPNIQLSAYGIEAHSAVTIVSDLKAHPIHVVIGSQSSFLYDAIAAGIPTLVLHTSLPYLDHLVERGIAGSVESPHDICASIRDAAALPESERARRSEVLGIPKSVSIEKTLDSILSE